MPELEDVDVTEQLLENEIGTRLSITDVTEKPGTSIKSGGEEISSQPEEIPFIRPKQDQHDEGIFSSNSM